MKYELQHRSGKYNGGHWEVEWDFTVEGNIVFADIHDNVIITNVASYYDGIVIILNNIPSRIDVTSSGDIWLFGKVSSELFKEPYKSSDRMTSQTVFKLGEREQVTLEEVGDIVYG